MITVEQINVEIIEDGDGNPVPLTEEQQLTLEMLVKNYDGYAKNTAVWPGLSAKIDAEQVTPTVKSKALKAVLTAYSKLPKLKVESQGTDKRQSYFSTKDNWDELAKDVLNVLFELPVVSNGTSLLVFQRSVVPNNSNGCLANRPFFVRD